MHRNITLIHEFYSAFARLDYRAMQEAYADEAIFYDPVFQNLDAAQTRSMWQMLCTNAKNFSLHHSEVIADEDYGSCNWTANYTFQPRAGLFTIGSMLTFGSKTERSSSTRTISIFIPGADKPLVYAERCWDGAMWLDKK